MSTTTQILFNSPALHSLKRDQLVKLCKIHALKANGKNKELIERLRLHAKTLPLDDPLSIATRSDNMDAKPVTDSEDETSNCSPERLASASDTTTRPSEQWEVVMDTIAEVDEETLRSNRGGSDRQVDEFGTHTSKASVTSSLRAIATSLGLKRNPSKSGGTSSSSSSLSGKDAAQSSSTLPTSEPNGSPAEPPLEPIPGQSNREGLPAPSEARLSLSQAPATTTIRLVSNPTAHPEVLLSPPRLQAFATSFDLVPGTPGVTGTPSVPVWPFSPGEAARQSLYPSIPNFQGFGNLLSKQQSTQYDNSDMDIDVDMPGGLAIPSICEPTPQKHNANARFNTGATPKFTEKPSADLVDIFSPAPKPQNASTRSRLAIPRSEPFVFGSPLPQHNMSNLQFRTATQSILDEMNKRLAEEGIETVDADVLNKPSATTEALVPRQENKGPAGVAGMFEKMHQKEFDKMDSIASHYAAKRGAQSTTSQPILSKKRKSSLVVKDRQSGMPTARHRPSGHRVVSGASAKTLPGGFGEYDDEDDEVTNRRMSKRPRVEKEESDAPAQPARVSVAPPVDPEEEAQKQKEREAIRRRLDHNKAKRRSSKGRPSVGLATPAKSKPARFGFFASAKSLVQNVWNRGAGSRAPSNLPVSKLALSKTIETNKTAVIPGSAGAPPLGSQAKRAPSNGSNSLLQHNISSRSILVPPARVLSDEGEGAATSSGVSRPPIPFNLPGSATVAGHGRASIRGSSVVAFSSLGSRAGSSAHSNHVSSMGAKSSIRNSAANLQKQVASVARSRTSSTLMAPTASSLAKINSHSRIPVATAAQNENSIATKASTSCKQRLALSPQSSATLGYITNSPQSLTHSPRPAKIFHQPLSPPLARTPMSLTAAASSIVGKQNKERPFSSPSKPPIPPPAKVLPGRRPRISRSKVIAKLASQRAAGASSIPRTGTEKSGGKVRSSMGAEVAGKSRQSCGGARGGDLLMSAKKRVRQSEHAWRRGRAADARKMAVD